MIYVASSWRNPIYVAVVAALRSAGLEHYDFRADGFSWRDVDSSVDATGLDVERFRAMLAHPVAVAGFDRDFTAMEKADTFVLVLPCGRSAHLELGWAVGQGKRTAVLLEDPVQPELMYRMVDYLAPSLWDLLGWLGVED